MKETIRIISDICYNHLLDFTEFSELRANYNENSYNQAELQYVNIPTKFHLEEIKLGFTPGDDGRSSIEIFKQLMELDLVQANDKRFWTCLTHTYFFEYTRKRWGIGKETSDNTIISRFFFEGAGIETRMRNSISRLWWAAKLTYDEQREDCFELTDLLWERQDLFTAIMERSMASYPNFVVAMLEFYQVNRHLKEDQLRFIFRGINAIGGVKLLPNLNRMEIIEEIKRLCNYRNILIN